MIVYKLCTDVDINFVYQAFQIGYSDYVIQTKMSKETFVNRFLGPEGNELQFSHVAFDDKNPVGLILSGIKTYEGIKTLRCGTLCIHPDYRGKGISQKLFELHREIAADNDCKQLLLEVIMGNDRAINFYKKQGYEKVYDLSYFKHKEPSCIQRDEYCWYKIKEISFELLSSLKDKLYDVHINWQNDFDYMEKLEEQVYYGAYDEGKLIGAISSSTDGKIYFIWVDPVYRNRGIATKLVSYIVKKLKPQELCINFPNSNKLYGFIKKLGFSKNIKQYEMYLSL